MAARPVARVIVEVLASAGATRVYGVAGDSLNGITDALYDRRDIRSIPCVFALYMAKAVLSGRGDEIVDLARTNLFR